jgi:hypothetical protein
MFPLSQGVGIFYYILYTLLRINQGRIIATKSEKDLPITLR